MLKTSRNVRTLLFGAVLALMVGLLGPTNSAVAANPVTLNAAITGTPAVGETLTAVASSVNPGNAALTYKWETTDSTDSLGTSSTFVPTSAQVGKQIKVTITGTAANRDPGSATSAPTAAVQNGFSGTPVVTISDTTPVVGTAVTASLAGEDPAATSKTYQWFLGANAIPNATTDSYTPVATDVGKTLTAKVTASKDGYLSKTFSSAATAAVAKGDFNPVPTVAISGTPKVDEVLTATVTDGNPVGTYTYQWYADNVAIGGAKSATFTPTGDSQVGKVITVKVTATKAGYNDFVATSPATLPVALATFTAPPTGTFDITNPKVGQLVTVTASGGTPTPGAYGYDWYRTDIMGVRRLIPGVTTATYTPTLTDLNKKLSVEITATRPGYVPLSAFTGTTARVNYIALNKTSVARGSTLTVTARQLRASQSYRIFIEGVSVYKGTATSGGTASRTVTVPKTIPIGTARVWVSGYNKSGVRDFQVMTTVEVL
jgi:hypothetical protein